MKILRETEILTGCSVLSVLEHAGPIIWILPPLIHGRIILVMFLQALNDTTIVDCKRVGAGSNI